jgi:hypothetical protein
MAEDSLSFIEKDCFGSSAAPRHRISLMAANGGKADAKNAGNPKF